MILHKNYIVLLIATIIFFGLGLILYTPFFSVAEIGIGSLWDAISFLMVQGSAYVLFILVFGYIKSTTKAFYLYKLMWIQEIIVTLGILGLGFGLMFMYYGMMVPPPPGVDPTAKFVASIALSLISVIYGFLGATPFYLIQKYYEFKNYNHKDVDIVKPIAGIQIQSLICFLIFFALIILGAILASSNAGIDITSIFSIDILIYIIIINVIFSFLYDGNYFNLYKNIFYYSSVDSKSIQYNLRFIRTMKKMLSIIISLILIIIPIVMLAALGLFDGETFGLILAKVAKYYFVTTLLIVISGILEGKEIGRLYSSTGKVIYGDRYFVFSYVLPPAIFFFIILLLTIYWTTLPV